MAWSNTSNSVDDLGLHLLDSTVALRPVPKLADFRSMKSVRSIPGATRSERTPNGASSCAKPSIQPSTANFDAE